MELSNLPFQLVSSTISRDVMFCLVQREKMEFCWTKKKEKTFYYRRERQKKKAFMHSAHEFNLIHSKFIWLFIKFEDSWFEVILGKVNEIVKRRRKKKSSSVKANINRLWKEEKLNTISLMGKNDMWLPKQINNRLCLQTKASTMKKEKTHMLFPIVRMSYAEQQD